MEKQKKITDYTKKGGMSKNDKFCDLLSVGSEMEKVFREDIIQNFRESNDLFTTSKKCFPEMDNETLMRVVVFADIWNKIFRR